MEERKRISELRAAGVLFVLLIGVLVALLLPTVQAAPRRRIASPPKKFDRD